MAKTDFKKAEDQKETPKKVKSNTVKFRVSVPFNGYSRGQIINGVERAKAAKWVLKERGEIID